MPTPSSAPRAATVQLAPGTRKPKENLTFRPSWPSGRPGTAPGLPRSSGRPAKGRHGAPRACRGARHDLARPALGRSRPAEELRKACPGPPQSAQALPRSLPEPGKAHPGHPKSCPDAGNGPARLPRLAPVPRSCPRPAQKPPEAQGLPRSCPRASQELPKSCPGAAQDPHAALQAWGQPTLPQDGFRKSSLRSTTQDIVEKASEHAVEAASRPMSNVSSRGGCREAELDSRIE